MLLAIIVIKLWVAVLLIAIAVLWVLMVWISTGDVRQRFKWRHGHRTRGH